MGWLPWTSPYTGHIRILAGQVMAMGGAVTAVALFTIGHLTENEKLLVYCNQACKYTWHGIANQMRGALEVRPWIGNLSALYYDVNLQWRLGYEYETPAPKTIRV